MGGILLANLIHAAVEHFATLVHQAEDQKHGATLVLDLNPSPAIISGQCFDRALDLRKPAILDLAKSLLRVDGALHIGADLHLHGFQDDQDLAGPLGLPDVSERL